MELIAAVMKGATSDSRNTDAKTLLNYGFSTYTLLHIEPEEPLPILSVTRGAADQVSTVLPEEGCAVLLKKEQASGLTQTVELPEAAAAPVAAGDRLGTLTVSREGETILAIPLLAGETVERLTWGQAAVQLLRTLTFRS